MRTLLIVVCCLVSVLVHAQPLPDLIPYKDGELYGYSDSNGRVIINPQWKKVGFFHDGKAWVKPNNSLGEWALINAKGRYIIAPEQGWDGRFDIIANGLNMHDTDGKMGYINDKGKTVIPCLYNMPSKSYSYNPHLKKYYLSVFKDKKAGLIDTNGKVLFKFKYEQLLFPYVLSYTQTTSSFPNNTYLNKRGPEPSNALKKYVIARKNDGYALLTITGKVLIPFGAYKHIAFVAPCWIGVVKDSLYGLMDTNLNHVTTYNYTDVPTVLNDTLFTIANGSRRGVINLAGREVIPMRYNSVALNSINDNLAYLTLTRYNNVGGTMRWQEQTVNLQTWKFSEWHEESDPFSQQAACGTGRRMMQMEYDRISRLPKLMVNGAYATTFTVGDTLWRTEIYLGVNKIRVHAYIRQSEKSLYGVVDNSRHFLMKHTRDIKPFVYHSATNTYTAMISDTDGNWLWTLIDTNAKIVSTPQYHFIRKTFRFQGHIYALATHLLHTYDEYNRYNNEIQDEYMHLLDSSGNQVAALANYRLLGYASASGIIDEKLSKPFEGVLFATDSLQRQGFVSVDGTVLFPKISFKYRELKGMGNNYFLRSNDTWRDILINAEDIEYFPGLKVSSMRQIGQTFDKGICNDCLYELNITQNNKVANDVYLGRNGILYMKH